MRRAGSHRYLAERLRVRAGDSHVPACTDRPASETHAALSLAACTGPSAAQSHSQRSSPSHTVELRSGPVTLTAHTA